MKRALAALLVFTANAAAQLPKGTLWRGPGDVAALDFGGAVGAPIGLPKPPFTFTKEDTSGTQPKVFVRDAAGATWNVKFGNEVRNESFCWRILSACGYFAEPNFFVAAGKFEGFKPISRNDPTLHPDGTFTSGRFQFRDPELKFLNDRNWRWDRPPYAGTKELSGLKILIMLFANWDNKDARVGAAGGPNTAIFELKKPNHTEFLYAFTDWGAGLGSDPADPSSRAIWRCSEFAAQSAGFVKGADNGKVVFGYNGNINTGFQTGIPVAHAAWLMNYLGRISDAQLRAGLKASGASDADTDCFTKALRFRIEQLRAAGAHSSQP